MELIEVVAIWIGICLSLLTAVKLKLTCGKSSCQVGNPPSVSSSSSSSEDDSPEVRRVKHGGESTGDKRGGSVVGDNTERDTRGDTGATVLN